MWRIGEHERGCLISQRGKYCNNVNIYLSKQNVNLSLFYISIHTCMLYADEPKLINLLSTAVTRLLSLISFFCIVFFFCISVLTARRNHLN